MTMIKVVRTSSSRCCLFIQTLASSTASTTRIQHYRQFSAMTAPPPACLLEEMVVPSRQLFGPGPSNMAESIGNSQSRSLLGHLHPEFVKIMSDTREGLQYLFKTTNAYTLAASGTGHAGMECALLNLLERGEKLLVVQIGLWGQRAADLGRRLGAEVVVVEAPLGQAMETSKIIQALREHKPAVVFVCHGESSTGVCQPLEGLGDVCKETNTLLLVDTVASIGGAPFAMDALGVDCVYTATQKVLNAPPGLAPISFSDRAIQKVKGRKERVASFYFDCLELGNYWGCDGQPKRYHHTAPISTVYALREALALVAKEGIDNVIARHKKNVNYLYKKLAENNIQPFVENENWRLPCLTTIKVPENVAWKEVMDELMANGVEVAGGLGSTVGKIWRMGTFGVNSDEKKIDHVVNLLATAVNKRRSNFSRDVISPNMHIKLEDKKVGKKAKSTPRRKRRATSDSEDDFDDDHNPRIDFYSASLGTMNKKVTAQASRCLQELHDRIASPPAESPVDGSFERMFLFGSSSSEAEVKKEELDC